MDISLLLLVSVSVLSLVSGESSAFSDEQRRLAGLTVAMADEVDQLMRSMEHRHGWLTGNSPRSTSLLEDTLPFWLDHCVDHQHGGFTMALDQTGQVIDTDKGVWQQGRFTWLLGELYNNLEARSEWLDLARHGADFLLKHCFDEMMDGWFHVTREGKPIRKRRTLSANCSNRICRVGQGQR